MHYKCNTCNAEFDALEQGNQRQTKHDDGGNLTIVEEHDAVEELVDMADKLGVQISFVSADSQYGKELLLGFGGIAALLRYR